MPIEIVRDNIVMMNVDAIVNSTNSLLQMDSGVCKAIFEGAGIEELNNACRLLRPCSCGSAVISEGFMLPAKYIIHTVGPIWQGGDHEERKVLSLCYKNCLILAQRHCCNSIAFPLISSGSYGFPMAIALECAVFAILEYLREHDDINVLLVVYSKPALDAARKLFFHIEDRFNGKYIELRRDASKGYYYNYDFDMQKGFFTLKTIKQGGSLNESLNYLDPGFSSQLTWLIEKSGCKASDIYKAAQVDKRIFSKIKNNPHYKPSKKTVIAFIIALRLDLEESLDLLNKAGYTLSPSIKFDKIIEYHIIEKKYDINKLNEVLSKNDLVPLGST